MIVVENREQLIEIYLSPSIFKIPASTLYHPSSLIVMLSSSNLILATLVLVLLIRWYFFGNILFFEENTTALQPMQEYLVSICQQILPEPQSSLLSGILIGQKESLDQDFRKALTNTSTIHIVVVSGQNLSLLAGFTLGLAPYFGRKQTILGTIGLLIAYAILTGLQIPVLRAACMSLVSLAGMLFNREVNQVKILSVTLISMLLVNPSWIYSISFQLSFLATAGVMVLAPEFMKSDRLLPQFIKQDFWASFSAQALTIPVIAINFYQVSLVGLLTNLLVLWTIPLVMISGILAIAGGVLNLTVGQMLGFIPSLLLLYFVDIVNLTNPKWGSVLLPTFPATFWFGYYIVFIGIYFWIHQINSIKKNL